MQVMGVVGGMGPYAGLDLVRAIFDQTIAKSDFEHLPVALLSYPRSIPDRIAFLTGQSSQNPADEIARIALSLRDVGAAAIGIPCSTAHSPPIIDRVREILSLEEADSILTSIIEETIRGLEELCPGGRKVGVLSTASARAFSIYRTPLEHAGYEVLEPEAAAQERLVDDTIFNRDYGLKAYGNPVTDQARRQLERVIEQLADAGANAVILGCTELPLAITESEWVGAKIVNPTVELARGLIKRIQPDRLAPRR